MKRNITTKLTPEEISKLLFNTYEKPSTTTEIREILNNENNTQPKWTRVEEKDKEPFFDD